MPTPEVKNAGDFWGAKTFIVLAIIKRVHNASHHMSYVAYLRSPNSGLEQPYNCLINNP